MFDGISDDRLRVLAIMYGAFLIGVGWLLYRLAVKRHFLEVYLQLGANAILLAAAFGAVEGPYLNLYLLAVLVLAAVSILSACATGDSPSSPTACCMDTR